MIIIGIGIAAFLAWRTYDELSRTNPEGMRAGVVRIFQGAELVRILAAFVTSLFYVLGGNFRPVGQPLRATRLSFGRCASDED